MSEHENTNAPIATETTTDGIDTLPRPQGEGGKEGAGTGRGSHNLKPFFWDLVWPVLAEHGWTLEPGLRNRPGNDFYFMPPGVDRRNTRYRVDYFDSVSGVLRCIASDDRFGEHVQAYAAAEERSRQQRQAAMAERRLEKQRSIEARPKRPPPNRDYQAERSKRIQMAQDVAALVESGGGRGRRVRRRAPAKFDPSDHDRGRAFRGTSNRSRGSAGYAYDETTEYYGREASMSSDPSWGSCDGTDGSSSSSSSQGRGRAPSIDGTPPDVLASLLLSLSGTGGGATATDSSSTCSTSDMSTADPTSADETAEPRDPDKELPQEQSPRPRSPQRQEQPQLEPDASEAQFTDSSSGGVGMDGLVSSTGDQETLDCECEQQPRVEVC